MSGTAKIARENGRKGGRPKGAVSKNKRELAELCRAHDKPCIARLVQIALKGENDRDAITAISVLLDRGHGKAPQPHDGDGSGGPIILQVITGVPR